MAETQATFNDQHIINAEFQVPASDVQAGVQGTITLTASLTTVAPEFENYINGIRDEVEADRAEVSTNLDLAIDRAAAALASEEAALLSEQAAAASKSAALVSEQKAKASEVASAASEAASLASEHAAALSAAKAKVSEQASDASEANALASEQAAMASQVASKASEDAAKASEIAAQSSEDDAEVSQIAAKASEDAAAISEANAKTSETNAGIHEDDALAHRNKAHQWAEETHGVEVEAGEYSAKHHAINADHSEDAAYTSEQAARASEIAAGDSEAAAKASEINAANSESAASGSQAAAHQSETNAATSAGEAAASADTAGDSADAAMASETAAKTSETNAAASESSALQSKNLASQYANAASISETNTKASETAAAGSASAAATSESNAADSAVSASNDADAAQIARTGAETAQAATETLLDQFGDLYLGAKASDPTTDNDGDPLQDGASYFNTTEEVFKYYSGTAWVAPEDVATSAASQAQASASNAASSETAAAGSASTAQSAASTAVSARDAAQASKSAAATSESNAADSATNAAGSASSAQTAATTATTKASQASTSASNAAASETSAANSAAQAASDAAQIEASIDNALQPHLDAAHPHSQYPLATDVNNALAGKVSTSDNRLTNSREWTAGTVSQAEAEAGTSSTRRAWTALRVRQAINSAVNAIGNATQSVAGWMSPADKTKLDGIATGATANATDAQLRARSSHTGTQAISTVAGLDTALSGKVDTSDARLSDSRDWSATVVTQAEAQAGTSTTARKWTAQRVAQAISALGLKIGTTSSTAKAGNWMPTWAEVTGKPTTFTPESHTHSLSEVTDAGNLAALNTNASTANFLRGDGTWVTPPNTNTTYSEITTAEIDAGTASTLRTITGRRMKYALDKKSDTGHGHAIGDITGLQTAIDAKANTSTQVIAGTGLSGGGTLAANRTLSVNYGTAAGTAAQGNDSRLSNSREWTATTVSQAEAEAGTATTRRAWTAQRVRQAITAYAPPTGRTITAGTGLTGGGNLTANRTLSFDTAWGDRRFLPITIYSPTNGLLIRTDITVTSNAMFLLEIKGNSYGGAMINIMLEGYNYNTDNAIIQSKAKAIGTALAIRAFIYEGYLCFWLAQAGTFQSFAATCTHLNSASPDNRITSVTNSSYPTSGVSRLVTVTPSRVYDETNLNPVTTNTAQTITGNKNFTGDLQKSGTDVALINGNYSGLRAQATTKADVGLSAVPNVDMRNASNMTSGTVPNARLPTTATRWPTYAEVTSKPGTVSQAEAQAGTATTVSMWTAQRVSQAISALGLKIGTTATTAKAGNWMPTWANVTGKPTTFTPSAHTHTLSQITGAGNLASLSTNASTSNYLRGDGTWVTPPNTTYSAGNGISLSGTTFSVAAGTGLSQQTGGLAVDSTVIRTTGDQNLGGVKTFTTRLRVTGTSKAAGCFYAGTSNPTNSTRLNYDGNLHAFTFIEPSDIRMKEDLTVIQDATEIVKSLNGYKFTMKESGERKVGLIAQEVLEVLPEAVKGSEETGYGLAYGDLVGLLVQTIKEMDKRIQDLESK